MNQVEFEARIAPEGFTHIEMKALEPRPANTEHAHDYAICGLVLEGTFTVVQNNEPAVYHAGQVFNVPADQPHAEAIGPDGARIVIGRNY